MSMIARILLSTIISASAAGICWASQAQGQDEAKGIQADEYVRKRPKRAFNPTATSRRSAPRVKARPRAYRPVRSSRPISVSAPGKSEEFAYLGITIWRFEPVADSDGPKILTEVDPSTRRPVVGRRVDSENRLSVGDLVRIGVESGSHTGNLYVINREKFADGTYGEARLIFPTGDRAAARNFVQPGMLIYFPSAERFLRVDSNAKIRQDAEELIIILSPTQLIDRTRLKPGHLDLTDAEVNEWISKWAVIPDKVELEGGAGEAMTAEEKSAGDQSKGLNLVSLTQDDAVPQTVYRMTIKRGNPVLAKVELKIDSGQPAGTK